MNFEFATASRIRFGPGTLAEAGTIAAGIGRRAFVIGGRDLGRLGPLTARLEAAGLVCATASTSPEPDFDSLRALAEAARAFGPDLVIGMGGGSAMDAAKAVAALVTNGGDPLDYAETVGKGLPLAKPSLPCIAIPTTSGTGSEVTRNAVFTAHVAGEPSLKFSLRSPTMLPVVALVDPELTQGLPWKLTLGPGLDAIAQLVEPLVSARANPLVDAFCREGLSRALPALLRMAAGKDAASVADEIGARQELSFASLLGGLALANAGLGAVHGIAGPLGGASGAAHGALCGALLGAVVSANVAALRSRAPGSPALARYAEVAAIFARALGEPELPPAAAAATAGQLVTRYTKQLHAPSLRDLGIEASTFAMLAPRALAANSMKGNPLALTESEIRTILEAAY
ncbi:MAG: iron-containing alcohol dehydrogenase [Rectinemataceae bacterium]